MDSNFNEVFARRLSMFMNEHKMSQAALAKRMEVSEPTVSYWIKGAKVPRSAKIDRLCSIFGCKRSDLLEDSKAVNIEEQEMVRLYQNASEEIRKAALAVLKAGQQTSEPKD